MAQPEDSSQANVKGQATRRACLLTVALALYVTSRIPLLFVGFGSDSDAWSMASKANSLIRDHHYEPSRFPGHPVHELLGSAAIVLGGALAGNLVSLAASGALLLFVYVLARRHGISNPTWVILMVALHPLIWTTSADSSDFMLAAALAYGSLAFASYGRSVLAGLALGFAMGTRIETVAFLLPMAFLAQRVQWRTTLAVCALTSAFCYLPVVSFYLDAPVPLWAVHVGGLGLGRRVFLFLVAIWAGWGVVTLLAASALAWSRRRALASLWSAGDPMLRAVVYLCVAYLLVTFLHPTKSTYFVPLVPLVFLAAARFTTVAWRMLLLTTTLIYAFVYPDVVDVRKGSVVFDLRLNNGLVVKDFISRWNSAHAAALVDQGRAPTHSVTILAYWLPVWRHSHPEAQPLERLPSGESLDRRRNEAFLTVDGAITVHNLDRATLEALQHRGMVAAYAQGVEDFLLEVHGYNIAQTGARGIEVLELNSEIAERFTLPVLVRCAWKDHRSWSACVRSASAQ